MKNNIKLAMACHLGTIFSVSHILIRLDDGLMTTWHKAIKTNMLIDQKQNHLKNSNLLSINAFDIIFSHSGMFSDLSSWSAGLVEQSPNLIIL